MPHNYAMGTEGHQFTEVGPDGKLVSLSWPAGGQREVVHVPLKAQSERFRNRIASGNIALVEEKATAPRSSDLPKVTRRLMAGGSPEALETNAQPAGPVYRWAFDPRKGERVRIPLGKGLRTPEQILADGDQTPAEAAELQQRARLEKAAAKAAPEETEEADDDAQDAGGATQTPDDSTDDGTEGTPQVAGGEGDEGGSTTDEGDETDEDKPKE